MKLVGVLAVVLCGSVEALVPFFCVVGAVADFLPQTCLRQVRTGVFNGLLRQAAALLRLFKALVRMVYALLVRAKACGVVVVVPLGYRAGVVLCQ